jgi:hypothetical protein
LEKKAFTLMLFPIHYIAAIPNPSSTHTANIQKNEKHGKDLSKKKMILLINDVAYDKKKHNHKKILILILKLTLEHQ